MFKVAAALAIGAQASLEMDFTAITALEEEMFTNGKWLEIYFLILTLFYITGQEMFVPLYAQMEAEDAKQKGMMIS